jgi:hypothetical protein
LISIFAIHKVLGFFVKDVQVKIPEPAEERQEEEVHVTG